MLDWDAGYGGAYTENDLLDGHSFLLSCSATAFCKVVHHRARPFVFAWLFFAFCVVFLRLVVHEMSIELDARRTSVFRLRNQDVVQHWPIASGIDIFLDRRM